MAGFFGDNEKREPWRDGVYLMTAHNSFEADMMVGKLESEGIPSIKRYIGASNFIEIAMGTQSAYPIEIYVPEPLLEKAKEVIKPVPIDDDFEPAGAEDEE